MTRLLGQGQQATETRQRRQDGVTLQELANSYNVSKAKISRLKRIKMLDGDYKLGSSV